jgi:hypothetical protein
MLKPKILTVAIVAAIAFSPNASFGGPATPVVNTTHSKPVVPYVIFGCAGSIIFSALFANYQQRRQLTWNEAASCGLLYWFNPTKRTY